jgi:hypothetical protein
LSCLKRSFLPKDLSSNGGNPFFISFALSITISSGVLAPPPAAILG